MLLLWEEFDENISNAFYEITSIIDDAFYRIDLFNSVRNKKINQLEFITDLCLTNKKEVMSFFTITYQERKAAL